jgi:hypothetical protein
MIKYTSTKTADRTRLWTHSMRSLGYAQFLLYAALYMLLPVLPLWMAQTWDCSYAVAGWLTALSAPAMWIPGAFNSYLIDAFPRKSVGMWAILVMVATVLAMPAATSLALVALLRVVQGMAFGVVTMTIGSTLVIDVAPSNRRSDANAAFVWIARLGMTAGAALGFYVYAYYGMQTTVTLAAVLGVVAMLCLPMVSVPFRAPLHAPLCTMDRFFLPRAWFLLCNLLPVVLVAGAVVARVKDEPGYIALGVGALAGWMVWRWVLPRATDRAGIELGLAAMIGGLLLMVYAGEDVTHCIACFLVAAGVGLAASHLFGVIVGMAQHCERGSANNSYQLLWELGLMVGVGVASCVAAEDESYLYAVCVALSLVALGIYEGFVHGWVGRSLSVKQSNFRYIL